MESQNSQEREEDIAPGEVHQMVIDEEVKPAAGASSAEERCPICLEDFQDKAFIDACFHTFCFSCVVRWGETTTTSCPMCKAVFSRVIHNVRANDDYDVFKIVPKPSSLSANEEAIDLEAALRSFRGYRTTMLPGQPARSQPSTSSASIVRPRPFIYGRGIRKRRRDSRKAASTQRRRAVYSAGVWALPPTRERNGTKPLRIRDISASFFRSNPAATHRLYPWLGRELEVLVGEEHVQFVIQLITSLIDKVDLQSDEFPSYLEPYLHEKTGHFMHEFASFASSPFDMIAYDQNVAYNWPASHSENESRETGDATQGSSTDIQQRILDELTSTSWDDSPPILETTSPSYLDHSSDSDFAREGSEAENTANNSATLTQVVDERGVATTQGVEQTKELSHQRVGEESASSLRVTGEATSLSHSEEKVTSNQQSNAEPDEQARTHTVKRESTVENLSSTNFASNSQLQCQSSDPTKEEFEISLFAEEEGSGDEYKELVREKTPEQGSAKFHSRRAKPSLGNTSSRDRQYRKDKRNDRSSIGHRNREDRNQERRFSGKSLREKAKIRERSRSRDRLSSRHSHRDRNSDHSARRNSHSKSRRSSRHSHSHRYSPPTDGEHFHHHSFDDRETQSVSDNAYYGRDKNHRSKLYSDEVSESDSKSRMHSRPRGVDQRLEASATGRHTRGAADATRASSAKNDTSESQQQALHRELNVLDKEINENKRDLLKSMLRRERIELLRKSLYPQDCTNRLSPLAVETCPCSEEASVGDMQKELKSLEVAILDGKKHLLKVMKKIEEDQVEQDSD